MKKDIHPDYKKTTIKCVCGNVIETRSTKGDFDVQICSNCHPFFTGKQKFVDTAGRVERFRRRYGDVGLKKQAAESTAAAEASAKTEAPAEAKAPAEAEAPAKAEASAEAPAENPAA